MENSRRTSAARLKLLRDLIKSEAVSTQQHLVEKLRQAGYEVTQSTISRDLKKIGAMKIFLPDGTYKYTLPEGAPVAIDDRIVTIVRKSILDMSYRSPILVVKTVPGTARSVARAIDSIQIKGIVGTVAGDDTIFILTQDDISAYEVKEKLHDIIEK
ncbi:arginine repressor [Coprothermobacteraceae bacterium]|nr:arginine repressor [Coprothermobacteraceae bacterium]